MSVESSRNQPFPRGALIGAAAVLGVAIASAAVARLGDVGVVRMEPSAAVESRELRFLDEPNGGVGIYEGATQIKVLPPGTNGFARGALRGLARERGRQNIGAEPPFRLVRRADGRLSLEDPATGRRIDLDAFGPTNAGVFAQLLPGREGAR